ncbi:MAG: tetratricopeptide repeat protein [Treponema sp.]|jgi:tetratricopeptide (TPR) repeat protein|nr:tetratricopeptide repeat protein [Treponema sp.]
MKVKKEIIIGLSVIFVIAAAIIGGTIWQKNRSRTTLAERIVEMGRGGPPQGIKDLREAITLYEKEIEQHVKDAAQTGAYWKILATRLHDRALFGEALNAYERAIYYMPEDHSLHYMRGLCAATIAKSRYDNPAEQTYYFTLAEHAYLRAIELAPDYSRPRYGIAVLYVYELGLPEEAIPHLTHYLELSRNNVDGVLLLAAAQYMSGNDNEALALCDRAITLTKDRNKIAETEQFKNRILNSRY